MGDRILVLGIGNPLVGDEGVGVRVAEALMSSWVFPDGVTVMDAGTMGMSLLGLLGEHDHVIVIDALDGTGTPPGTVMRVEPDELATTQVLHSLHDIRFSDVLQAAALAGSTPETSFVGIQVGSMEELVTELTPEVEDAVRRAADEVLAVLDDLGVVPEATESDLDAARVIRAIRTGEPMRRRAPEE